VIPLRDDNPAATVPVVLRTLIALNVVVFIYEVLLGPELRPFLFDWGFVPEKLTLALKYGDVPLLSAALPVLTSMFLHGGWPHLIGNMWYLWIFGDNVEDALGHARFLVFYLACGVVAALIQYLTMPFARVPTVGASGAIAAVLGAYIGAFPRARVHPAAAVPVHPGRAAARLPGARTLVPVPVRARARCAPRHGERRHRLLGAHRRLRRRAGRDAGAARRAPAPLAGVGGVAEARKSAGRAVAFPAPMT
jgi:membrane associated rhomboid family serine protease